jgi:DNA-binding CsgD family transcriptional regulator
MHSSRVANKVKQVGKGNSAEADSSTMRLPKRSDTGFLLLNAALKPLYVNPQAEEILFHPERPTTAKDFSSQLASKIHTIVASGGPSGKISVCKEFVSGRRHYVCRFFDAGHLGNKSSGSNESSWALLLERGSETAADILKFCDKYHLSHREGEAVRCLVEGLTNKEIAARMLISPDTVKVFLRLAMMKIGVSSRSGIMSKFIHLKA